MFISSDSVIDFSEKYDVIVIGAGHAGCEAGLVSARMGMRTAMFCTEEESVAMMPCNPSIGGTGKGHIVREIDALGGEMGINTDKTFIQSKMLNTSKGPAVHSLRAQADKHKYHEEMLKTIKEQDNLCLICEEVTDIVLIRDNIIKGESNKNCDTGFSETSLKKNIDEKFNLIGSICGVKAGDKYYKAETVIICTGTYLGGKIFIGDYVEESGPAGLKSATALAENIIRLGLPMRRFKTGTPARMLKDSLDYSKMKEQKGDDRIVPFSFMDEDREYDFEQVSCWLSYTNAETHRIILDNINKSAMYSGNIVGIGPRYCPSIEDKVSRFRDRERHQLFVEPEGLHTDWMYIQGMSSSLPEDVQHEFYATIPGLEHATIVKPAYAIEYDCVDPLSLKPSLESKMIDGFFCAGQFNGSSGYEEAASQGLIAGINAVRKIRGLEPMILGRDQAYIGVLIDDLVTKGTNEPYRMMTSRAEYRLLLRQDNADRRLTQLGYEYGSVSEDRYSRFINKKNRVDSEIERLRTAKTDHASLRHFLLEHECNTSLGLDDVIVERRREDIINGENQTFYDILRRPTISYDDLSEIDDETRPALSESEKTEVEVEIKYEGYIRKQIIEVEKLHKLEKKKLSEDIDYDSILGLRLEARQKLNKVKPVTVGQASRVSGVSPADVNVLLVWLEKYK